MLLVSVATNADEYSQLLEQVDSIITMSATVSDLTSVQEEDPERAEALRDEGVALHDDGQEDETLEKLEDALDVLGDGS